MKQHVIIGIDYSLNSTGICIRIGNEYKWGLVTSAKKSALHKKLSQIVNIKYYDIPLMSDEYHKMFRLSIITDLIFEIIQDTIWNKEYDVEVRIEGFSYNSKGSSFIDLIQGQSFLRRDLIDYKLWPHIIAPKMLKKKFTNSGNADKLVMLDSFMIISTNLRDKFNEINSNDKALVTKGGKLVSPVSDLVDAFALTNIDVD